MTTGSITSPNEPHNQWLLEPWPMLGSQGRGGLLNTLRIPTQIGHPLRSNPDAKTGQIGHDYGAAVEVSDIPSESVSALDRNGCPK